MEYKYVLFSVKDYCFEKIYCSREFERDYYYFVFL